MIDFKKEEVTKKNKSLWEIIIIVLVAIVCVNYLITLCNKLEYASLAAVIVLTASIVTCSLLITKLLSSYVYVLLQGSLIFEKKIGSKSKTLLKIKLQDIDFIKPYKEIKDTKNIVLNKFIIRGVKNTIYYVQFTENNKKCGVIFQPTDSFISAIEKKMRSEKEKKLTEI
ncbi:hypothetical protein PV797_21220 [Clostridiaceae bacterium M8S5]|nr:hypothetical protein PV797_21220 [Clostridiaceae bacterium M8S5]